MNSSEKRLAWLIIFIALILKLSIHFYSNGAYGFHRDELLHLAVSQHLDWGFMEFPPMIGFLGSIGTGLFGNSVLGTRVLPMLAGMAMLFITFRMTLEMGGKVGATFLTACTFLGVYAYWRNHTLFQPVVFDQLFWTIGSFLFLKFLKNRKTSQLLLIGIVAGLGLMTKYTMLFWGVGFVVGLLFYQKGKVFQEKGVWIAGGIVLIIFLPNILWQIEHNLPVLGHLSGLYEVQLEESSRLDFLEGQLSGMNPFNFVIWFTGLIALFFSKPLHKFKPLGIAFLVSGFLLFITKGRAYYFYAAYPVVLASGAVLIEQFCAKKRMQWLLYPIGSIIIIVGMLALPYLAPVLPIQQFAQYAELEMNQEGRLEGLSGDYADMFGWNEQVALVDSIYQTLTEEEQKHCILWAENYGEAGAIAHLGKQYNLPKPVCKHGSFWLWGTGTNNGEIAISVGNEDDAVDYFYAEKILIKTIKHPYAIDEEHNIPLYLCRKPKVRLKEYWSEYESRIFE